MRRLLIAGGVLTLLAVTCAGRAAAQESKAAAATRKNLQQKLTLSVKEVGLKNFLETDLNGEIDKPIRFQFDNASGISNNMKVSFSGKNVTVEKVLNELADKYDFGYYVISNKGNNKVDGKVLIRKYKDKERGYQAGKEPKKGARLVRPRRLGAPVHLLTLRAPCVLAPASLVAAPRRCYGRRGGMVLA